jgi:thiazole synthase
MAAAIALAARAGRLAFGAGRMPRRPEAEASTPRDGRIGTVDEPAS